MPHPAQPVPYFGDDDRARPQHRGIPHPCEVSTEVGGAAGGRERRADGVACMVQRILNPFAASCLVALKADCHFSGGAVIEFTASMCADVPPSPPLL